MVVTTIPISLFLLYFFKFYNLLLSLIKPIGYPFGYKFSPILLDIKEFYFLLLLKSFINIISNNLLIIINY